jgi:hypothetical protein
MDRASGLLAANTTTSAPCVGEQMMQREAARDVPRLQRAMRHRVELRCYAAPGNWGGEYVRGGAWGSAWVSAGPCCATRLPIPVMSPKRSASASPEPSTACCMFCVP